MVIILDGINHLPLKYHDLHWLPQGLPPNVYIVLSSTPEPAVMEAVKTRSGGVLSTETSGAGEGQWTHIPIQPLAHVEKDQILQAILNKNRMQVTEDLVHFLPFCVASV